MEKLTTLMLRQNVDPKDVLYCDEEGNFTLSDSAALELARPYTANCYFSSYEQMLTTRYNVSMVIMYQGFYEPNNDYLGRIKIGKLLSYSLINAKLTERILNPSKLWEYCTDWLKQYSDFIEKAHGTYSMRDTLGDMFAKHLKEIFKNDDNQNEETE